MASPAPGVQNKNRVAILADLDKEKRHLTHNSPMNNPGARPALNKAFRDHTEQQRIAAQQEAALQHAHAHSSGFFITQDSSFGNLILPVLPQLDPPLPAELQNLNKYTAERPNGLKAAGGHGVTDQL